LPQSAKSGMTKAQSMKGKADAGFTKTGLFATGQAILLIGCCYRQPHQQAVMVVMYDAHPQH
jgi:hypothetical protein